jgi:hypothetical protein
MWKGSHGMPEVFTITFFASWLCNRIISVTVIASSVRRPIPPFFKKHSFFFPPPHFKTKKTPRWILYGEDFLAAGNTIGERM